MSYRSNITGEKIFDLQSRRARDEKFSEHKKIIGRSNPANLKMDNGPCWEKLIIGVYIKQATCTKFGVYMYIWSKKSLDS